MGNAYKKFLTVLIKVYFDLTKYRALLKQNFNPCYRLKCFE